MNQAHRTNRRRLLGALPGLTGLRALPLPGVLAGVGVPHAATAATAAATEAMAPVLPGRPLSFPRDHGAHLQHRLEWWYLTGWLEANPSPLGFQITFFRTRPGHDPANPSRFAPHQILMAHAALADPARGRLSVDERAARTGFADTTLDASDTRLRLRDWSLERTAEDRYRTRVQTRDFRLDLTLTPTAVPFPQGDAGYSRKGPRPEQASYYYSRPGLRTEARLTLAGGRERELSGLAWLDHEWSSELLDPAARGWDWVGLHFDDGSALMAFRLRTRDGATLWSHARWIGRPEAARPEFEVLRSWRSPRTGAQWPVAQRLRVDSRVFELQALMDDQELDTRSSTGTVYWEGAVFVLEQGRRVGRGYLELTGYHEPLRL